MNLIKLYHGKNNSVLALFENDTGYYVTESGAGWNKALIARNDIVSASEAMAYIADIAQHCPLCYQPDDQSQALTGN